MAYSFRSGGGGDRPYPPSWEEVAEIRVFRAPSAEWSKLSDWSADMRKRGWRLLRVSSDAGQIVAVYGKSRNARSENP